MVAFVGLALIAIGVICGYKGVIKPISSSRFSRKLVYRDEEPDEFRKDVAAYIIIGLLAIIGWFIHLIWPYLLVIIR